MVRYGKGHRQESRARILEAAGRGFRRSGYGGAGVDGLAREAGVTHGAFYAHFRSKAEAFRATLTAGLEDLRAGVEAVRAQHGDGWIAVFVAFYLGHRRTCDLGEACALPTLSPEVERTGPETRLAYQAALNGVIDAMADGLPGRDHEARRARAWALLSLLSGGVTLARAVPDADMSEEIARSIVDSVQTMSC